MALFNSHSGGMAVERPYGLEMDFLRNPIFGSAASSCDSLMNPKIHFTLIFEIQLFK